MNKTLTTQKIKIATLMLLFAFFAAPKDNATKSVSQIS
jgi:hypothetical protein